MSAVRIAVPAVLAAALLARRAEAGRSHIIGDRYRPDVAAAAAAPRDTGGGVGTYRVVVDAGHGGTDDGMRGDAWGVRGVVEKHITLAVARAVREALAARGVDVVMTRDADTLIALDDRGRIANASHADLFVSIHVNAAARREPAAARLRGFETYFLSEARTDDARRVEAMENESARYDVASAVPPSDPLRLVLTDMAQNEQLRESSELAAVVQRHLARVHPSPNRGVKQAGFRVLVSTTMPAVLVELGFGSNAADAAVLTDPRSQQRLADAVATGVMEFLGRYAGHRRGTA